MHFKLKLEYHSSSQRANENRKNIRERSPNPKRTQETPKLLLATYTSTWQFGRGCFKATLKSPVSTKITEKRRAIKSSKAKLVANKENA